MHNINIVPEALPDLKPAQYAIVPHPENPIKKLVVHIARSAITSWHRPSLVGECLGLTDEKPTKGNRYLTLPHSTYLRLGFDGLPQAKDHQQLDILQGKIRDWIEESRPEHIMFDR